MAAIAKCDLCGKTTDIEVVPLGVALMPKDWLGAIREGKPVDVCSEECAQALDSRDGVEETVIRDVDAKGTLLDRTLKNTTTVQ